MYEDLLSRFTRMCQEALGEKLTGVYLHGSMALGCFNPKKSDLDLIVIAEQGLTDEEKLDLMNHIVALNQEAPEKGIEMSVVRRQCCSPFIYPTLYELHFSNSHLELFHTDPKEYIRKLQGTDKDLAAHFTIIRHCGIVLYGEPIEAVFAPVPKEAYVDSLWYDIENAREDILENPVYVILNLCRVLAYLRSGEVLSKKTGGEWGIRELPREFHPLLQEALHRYETDGQMRPDAEAAQRFAEYMLAEMKEAEI